LEDSDECREWSGEPVGVPCFGVCDYARKYPVIDRTIVKKVPPLPRGGDVEQIVLKVSQNGSVAYGVVFQVYELEEADEGNRAKTRFDVTVLGNVVGVTSSAADVPPFGKQKLLKATPMRRVVQWESADCDDMYSLYRKHARYYFWWV
jgi:hypothetical protein